MIPEWYNRNLTVEIVRSDECIGQRSGSTMEDMDMKIGRLVGEVFRDYGSVSIMTPGGRRNPVLKLA